MNREACRASASQPGRGQLVPATVLECGDLSPLLRRRLVAVEVQRASEHAGTPALARAVCAPLLAHASCSPTATSRLKKAVTSHRTPNRAATRPCATCGWATRAPDGRGKAIPRRDCKRGDAKGRAPRSPSPLNGERVGVRGAHTHRVRLGFTAQFVFVRPFSSESCVSGSRGLAHPSPSFPLPVEGRGRSEAGSPVIVPIGVSPVRQFPSMCAGGEEFPRQGLLECGDLSPLSRGDLSPSNCRRRDLRMERSRLAPAVACARDRSRAELRRRPVACAKAVTSPRTPNRAPSQLCAPLAAWPRDESQPGRGQLVPATALECGDLSPLSRGDLSPSNCGGRDLRMERSRLAPAVACARDRSRAELRRRPVACAKAVTSHRTPNRAASQPCATLGRAARALVRSF